MHTSFSALLPRSMWANMLRFMYQITIFLQCLTPLFLNISCSVPILFQSYFNFIKSQQTNKTLFASILAWNFWAKITLIRCSVIWSRVEKSAYGGHKTTLCTTVHWWFYGFNANMWMSLKENERTNLSLFNIKNRQNYTLRHSF